jgi:hypothetical protein
MTVHRERIATENRFLGAAPFAALQPMTDAYVAFWKQAGEFQKEWLRFMSERIEKDMAHSSKLLNCRNPGDFFQAQLEFCNCFMDDYLKEGRKVGDLVSSATKEAQAKLEQEGGVAQKH